jgi:hypothetical protein
MGPGQTCCAREFAGGIIHRGGRGLTPGNGGMGTPVREVRVSHGRAIRLHALRGEGISLHGMNGIVSQNFLPERSLSLVR